MSKEVYCGGVNTGCHHEDKPTVEECSDCPYVSKAQLAHKSRPDREDIDSLLSQYSSGLLAWKGWGMEALGKAHDLKVEITNDFLALIPDEEEIRKELLIELESDGLIAHEIKAYGASGRECETYCAGCKSLKEKT